MPDALLENFGKILRSNNKDTHKKDAENEKFRENLGKLFQDLEINEEQEPISDDENELNKSKSSTSSL